MAEYIEREALLEDIEEERPENWTNSEAERQAENDFFKYRDIVKIQPTADVVEVVRCKDCQSYSDFDTTKCKRLEFHFCDKFGIITKESDFCSYGKRKEGVEE